MKLVENWLEQLFKAWSIRLAGLSAIIGAYFVAFPSELTRLVALVPVEYRDVFSIVAGLVIFATASGTRLVQQKNLTKP